MHCLITWIVWHCRSLLYCKGCLPRPAWVDATAAAAILLLECFVCDFFVFAPFFLPFFPYCLHKYVISLSDFRAIPHFFMQAHIFLLAFSQYLFIYTTHTHIYICSVRFSPQKNSKVFFFASFTHTTFGVVVFSSFTPNIIIWLYRWVGA